MGFEWSEVSAKIEKAFWAFQKFLLRFTKKNRGIIFFTRVEISHFFR